jgi:hypothetical protein
MSGWELFPLGLHVHVFPTLATLDFLSWRKLLYCELGVLGAKFVSAVVTNLCYERTHQYLYSEIVVS